MSVSRRRNLSNHDKKRVEPLVNLICYYLTQDRASRGRLRAKIREGRSAKVGRQTNASAASGRRPKSCKLNMSIA